MAAGFIFMGSALSTVGVDSSAGFCTPGASTPQRLYQLLPWHVPELTRMLRELLMVLPFLAVTVEAGPSQKEADPP